MLVEEAIVKSLLHDDTNLIVQAGNVVEESGCGSHTLGCALGLFVMSSVLSQHVTIPCDFEDLQHPTIRLILIGEMDVHEKSALDFCHSLISNFDEIHPLDCSTALKTIKKNESDVSIIISDFHKRFSSNPVDYSYYLRKNYRNDICCISRDSFSALLKKNTPGIDSLYYRSICIENEPSKILKDSGVISPTSYKEYRGRLYELIQRIANYGELEFLFTKKALNYVENIFNCSELIKINKLKYGLYDSFQTRTFWIATLFYIGSQEFAELLNANINAKHPPHQITVPDKYVDLALANVCVNYMPTSEKYLKTLSRGKHLL